MRNLRLFILLISCLLVFGKGFTQKIQEKKIKTSEEEKDKNGKTNTATTPYLDKKQELLYFKNINKVPYYYDDEKINNIAKYDKSADAKVMHEALLDYVLHFGIENFYKDTYIMWRLGKVAEELGYIDQAKSAYRLVLKHHRSGNIGQLVRYYDSLTSKEKDYFVPLDYYYKLVESRRAIDTLYIPLGIATRMTRAVNDSVYSDYAPTLTKRSDSRIIMVFTSKRNLGNVMDVKATNQQKPRRIYNEDLFFAVKMDTAYIIKTDEGTKVDTLPWTKAEPLTGLNTEYNEGSACITKDGNTIYFSRCESPDGFGNCDLYSAERLPNGAWGNVQNLGETVNTINWESHPALSQTGDTLYFSSDRLGGFGMADIYFTYKVRDETGGWTQVTDRSGKVSGLWATAQNIGPIINTRQSDVSPFFHPQFNVLYFSSNGHHNSFGNFDIYKSNRKNKKIENEQTYYWTEPQNVGPLINQLGNEYYFSIYGKNAEESLIYFSKADTNKVENMDLHSFPLPMEAQPNATVEVNGVVLDSLSGEALMGVVSVIDLDNGIEIAPKFIGPDGSYRFNLIKNNNYLIIITGDDFFRVERQFLLKGDTSINVSTPSMKFKKWEFTSINFPEAKWDVTPEMCSDLDKLVTFLVDHPNLALRIEGHTDSDGTAEANRELSQKRAEAIKNYITVKGKFKRERIDAIGLGSDDPIIKDEKTVEDKKINRRVEFQIIKVEDLGNK